MICKNCGQVNESSSRFCTHCGADLQNQNAAEGNQGSYTPPVYQQQSYQQPNYQQSYQQPNYQPDYRGSSYQVPYGAGPVQSRNLATCIILTIVTCGIYGWYWLYCMAEDLNKGANTPNPTSGGVVILLSIITCGIYQWVWMYKAGEQLCAARQNRRGYPGENSGVLYLVLSLFGLGIVSYALIQNELNQLAA